MAFRRYFPRWGYSGMAAAIFAATAMAILMGGLTVSYARDRLISIPLAALPQRADAQVLARVTEVHQMTGNSDIDKDTDEVSLTVTSVLQGKGQAGALTLILYTRGQGSNPPLKPGDTGVFFIKTLSPEMASQRRAIPAYPGSYALFPDPQQFTMPEPAPEYMSKSNSPSP